MKGKHKTFRFIEDQLTFVKTRNKLDSDQKALDFLLQAYWDVWHVKPNPFQVEPGNGQEQAVMNPKEHLESKPLVRSFDYWFKQIKDLEMPDDCNDWSAKVAVCPDLTPLEKKTLHERLRAKWQ
jgi:hypothetical protein